MTPLEAARHVIDVCSYDQMGMLTRPQVEQRLASLVQEVAATMTAASALKVGDMVMKVPRCETCAHWQRSKITDRTGICTNTPDDIDLVSDACLVVPCYQPGKTVATLFTRASFGCVQWKEK